MFIWKSIAPKDKKKIKCLFIYKVSPEESKRRHYEISLLTDDLTYYDCTLKLDATAISPFVWKKLRYAFLPFQFTPTTKVCLTGTPLSKYEPFMLWLLILKEQIQFTTYHVDYMRVPKRISSYHRAYLKRKDAEIKPKHIQVLWDKIIKYDKCPWITEEIDETLKTYSPTFYKRKQYIRLAAYYMLVKQDLVYKYYRSYGYRKKMGQLTPEELAAEAQKQSLGQQNVNNEERSHDET